MREKKSNKRVPLIIIGLVGVLIVIVLMAFLFLQGRTTISGDGGEEIKSDALSCVGNGVEYPKIKVGGNVPRTLEVNMVFRKDKISTISLIYTLKYGSKQEVVAAEAVGHASMNEAYAATGYKADEFDTKYTRYDDKLMITEYATDAKIDVKAAPFFMIDIEDEVRVKPKTLDDYKKNYEEKGLTCKKK